MQTKIIACYLPQYHEIPENNKWWGQGFTEWTNVKKAKPVFDWQKQPKVPLGQKYYNLLDKETVSWQTDLANKYGVYGFCYFHYYFNGKKLLEKPAENLLKWKDINQKFCFFWANESWARTWTAVKNSNTWVCEDEKETCKPGLLMEQAYGDEDDWKKHFEYLLPFFLDERYIKVDNKPMFYIYHINAITCLNDMLSLWNRLARQNGLNGIHVVSINSPVHDAPGVEAIAHYNFPTADSGIYSVIAKKLVHKIKRSICCLFTHMEKDVWEYDEMWDAILSMKPYGNVQNYPGAFVNYDDTPRRGSRGVMMKNASAEKFEHYMRRLLERANKIYKSEYVLLAAWNEWGEGNYLEPDEDNQYAYLEALKRALGSK